jgi:glutamate dehydrogenase (NAD(P)+)
MKEALKLQNIKNCKGISIAVQGFGNVGSHFAEIAYQNGAKILAITDAFGGVYNSDGINIMDLLNYVKESPRHSVENFSSADSITNEDLFKLDVDVLAPCAMQNQFTVDNADLINAKLIIEGANSPTTPNADVILNEKGVIIIPDILANAGGVTVSYFEWVQSLQSFFWTEKQINQALEDILINSFANVLKIQDKYKISDIRTSAMALAVQRVAKATELRGIFP